jgi:hypothetical protein
MPSLTDAKTIIDKASILLGDASQTRWFPSELLGYLNDGQTEITLMVPNCNPSTALITLVAGSKQEAPDDSIRINGFVRNMGVGGSTPGRIIREVTRAYMDAYVPNWTSSTPDDEVIHAVYDAEDNNKTFYVYPPQPNTPSQIEIVYSKVPTKVNDVNPGTKITIADYYSNALLDYILYRAFSKDSEYANQAERSANHYTAFVNAVGAKFKVDSAVSEDTRNDNRKDIRK